MGAENNGPSKQQGMKLQDMEFQDVKTEKLVSNHAEQTQNSLFVGSRFCSYPL